MKYNNPPAVLSLLISCSLLLTCFAAKAQSPLIEWSHCYGSSLMDYPKRIVQTADSGYMLSGVIDTADGEVTHYHGKNDIWLAKLSKTGSIVWQKAYGGSQNEIGSAIQTYDGGYFIAGSTASADGDITAIHGVSDAWVAKTDDTGSILWQYSFGGDSASTINAFCQATDSGYIMAGTIIGTSKDTTLTHGDIDFWIVKLNKSGVLQWQKIIGGSKADLPLVVAQTYNGGYIAGGFTASNDKDVSGNHGSADFWLVALDDTGGITWQKTYGGAKDDLLLSAQQTTDTGYILCGYASSSDGQVTGSHGNYDIWIIKTDKNGGIVWEKTYGSANQEFSHSIIQTGDGGYLIGGTASTNSGDVTGAHDSIKNSDVWILKIDSLGSLVWENCYGGSGADTDPYIIPTNDGGFAFAGTTESNDGDVSGYFGGFGDFWVVKFKNQPPSTNNVPSEKTDVIKVYPTITNSAIHIQLPPGYEKAQFRLLDLYGRETKYSASGNLPDRTISFINAANGLYILQLINNGSVQNFKIVYLQ